MTRPCISIVVEWDNIRHGELRRCVEMLRQLVEQAAELQSLVASGAADAAAGGG